MNMHLYRKRIVPNELIDLKNDIILHHEENLIITCWNTLKPRKDIANGISAYFINDKFKISKVFNHDRALVYWYCDIIDTIYDTATNSYIFTDLLVDVVLYPDNRVEILDLDELADTLLAGTITKETAAITLHDLNRLLSIIYQGDFIKYQSIVNEVICQHQQ